MASHCNDATEEPEQALAGSFNFLPQHSCSRVKCSRVAQGGNSVIPQLFLFASVGSAYSDFDHVTICITVLLQVMKTGIMY